MPEVGHVLVTGATGFVGSHLVDVLAARGTRIRALVRPSSDTRRLEGLGAELCRTGFDDARALREAVEGVDVVFHLAAATRATTEAEYERVNAGATEALVAAIRAADRPPRRLVYLSSLAAVGPSQNGRPVARDETPRPITAYGRTKLAGERIALAAANDVEVVVLRAPAVYGPRDRDLFIYFRLAARGFLPVPAGPDRLVQLIHAADLAEALVLGATAPGAAGVYHVAEPRPYAWREVARSIAAAVGRRAVEIPIPAGLVIASAAVSERIAALAGRATIFNREKARELLAAGWLCETESARAELGFEPRFELRQGLADTAAWYRANGWL
ncbi:MAG TPA: NAD-dependent epimerase/dehydratase family protein [Longimicrobiales bacterium]|nr:NAD-dependent epimerase/dehydratase family protein [Longimicrobiales bacterium]